jgi:hypothetical protein
MNTNFITTEDQLGKNYIVNCSEIAFIEDTDEKYVRIITLNIVDEMGNSIKIESIHSIIELNEMIKNPR